MHRLLEKFGLSEACAEFVRVAGVFFESPTCGCMLRGPVMQAGLSKKSLVALRLLCVLVSPTALDLAAGLVRGRRRREFNERSEERSLGWGG